MKLSLKMTMVPAEEGAKPPTLTVKPGDLDTALELFKDAAEAPDMAEVVLTSTSEPGNIPADVPAAAGASAA